MEKPGSTAGFYENLEVLRASFAGRKPELEATLRDPAIGLEGHVVVWNTGISLHGPLPGCGKGGTRIREGLTLDEVRMLARKMSVKNAAAGLPLGGAKSGINADPRAPDFERKYRRFVELCRPLLHENGGPFGGFGFDIGAAPIHATWCCETLGSLRSFTGKPVELGGTDYDKEGIAGLGVAEAAASLLELHGEDGAGIRFAVHGAGAMGAAVIRYFAATGPRLGALGDPKYGGTWRFERPLSAPLAEALATQDSDRVMRLLPVEGTLVSQDPNEVLFETADVLFPCALHGVIREDNASRVDARYIVEGANNPCDFAAYPLLHARNIQLIPDFIANSGGIIAAYIELTSDIGPEENARTRRKVELAKSTTRTKMRENVARIERCAVTFDVPFRDAALYVALHKILYPEED
ncbi:MAG: Glutamate dehydrogenase [Pseudomonadales bacterium]|nr:Glutamate dehydrogenase [Pseudomonadales bacterium]